MAAVSAARRPARITGARGRAALGLLAAALALGGAGCKLFDPAKPETPLSGVPIIIPNYTKIDSCLYYMRVGIEAKAYGQTAYLGTLADSIGRKDGVGFHATFDPAVWNAFTGPKPSDWNLDLETQFFGVFIKTYSGEYTMDWQPDLDHPDEYSESDPEVVVHRHYEVHTTLDTGNTLLIAVGYADLTFTRVGTRWVLRRWDDRVDPLVGAQPAVDDQRTIGYRRLNIGAGG